MTVILLPPECIKKLSDLSHNLRLDRNIVCRIALGSSLQQGVIENTGNRMLDGIEVDLSSILKHEDELFKTLLRHSIKNEISKENMTKLINAHIIRGIDLLTQLYIRKNSSVDFFKSLCGDDGEILLDMASIN